MCPSRMAEAFPPCPLSIVVGRENKASSIFQPTWKHAQKVIHWAVEEALSPCLCCHLHSTVFQYSVLIVFKTDLQNCQFLGNKRKQKTKNRHPIRNLLSHEWQSIGPERLVRLGVGFARLATPLVKSGSILPLYFASVGWKKPLGNPCQEVHQHFWHVMFSFSQGLTEASQFPGCCPRFL